MDTYHRWMEVVILGSMGGLPVINVPAGFDPQGRPMGMQIIGRFGDSDTVLILVQRVQGWLEQIDNLAADLETMGNKDPILKRISNGLGDAGLSVSRFAIE